MKRLGHLQSSIKEAVDNLPSGVCFFDKNGFVVLCNRTMYRLAFAITGRDLQTFSELENALRNLPEGALAHRDGDTFLLPDGTAWRFSSMSPAHAIHRWLPLRSATFIKAPGSWRRT